MQDEQDTKYQKQSVSMPPGLWERAVAKAKTIQPKTSTAAYICSLILKDLKKQKTAPLGTVLDKGRPKPKKRREVKFPPESDVPN